MWPNSRTGLFYLAISAIVFIIDKIAIKFLNIISLKDVKQSFKLLLLIRKNLYKIS